MTQTAMRARHSAVVASSLLAVLLLLLGVAIAVDAHLSAIWRVALESIDDPAAQEHDEATPANAPAAHRGGEATAGIAVSLAPLGLLAPGSDLAVSLDVSVVAGPRAPPTA